MSRRFENNSSSESIIFEIPTDVLLGAPDWPAARLTRLLVSMPAGSTYETLPDKLTMGIVAIVGEANSPTAPNCKVIYL